ncbi:hypothetical protein Goklo_024066 [Gossypium klotzschianum]|uniref:Uncharacterized protein n=1 Tax=Gossypium klotzschianum TaxID=34286 RepID=A0A7J8WE35_9ROSI|nr:hypothetical protein [Gossypium klotzschianum]
MYCNQATQDTPAWKDVYDDTSIWKDICKATPPDDLEQRIELELKCYRAREENKRKVEELNLTFDISCLKAPLVYLVSEPALQDLDEEIRKSRRPKNHRKSTQSEFYERWIKEDPNIGPLGEDNRKFIYLVDYSASKSKPQPPKVQNQPPTGPP